MEKRYDEDRQLYEKKKPASRKLTYLPVLSKKLRNVIFFVIEASDLGQIP